MSVNDPIMQLSTARSQVRNALRVIGRRDPDAPTRWLATVEYVDGSRSKIAFDEYDELGHRIEGGPDWHLIKAISVTLRTPAPIGDNWKAASPPAEVA